MTCAARSTRPSGSISAPRHRARLRCRSWPRSRQRWRMRAATTYAIELDRSMQLRERGIVSAVLAAGATRRLGRPKQLAAFRGRPLVCHALAAPMSVAGITASAVVLGAFADRIDSCLEDGVVRVWNPAWEEGIASSIRAAVAWA